MFMAEFLEFSIHIRRVTLDPSAFDGIHAAIILANVTNKNELLIVLDRYTRTPVDLAHFST